MRRKKIQNSRNIIVKKRYSKKSKGFTLIELLVAFVILGIIAGISIPLIRNVQNNNYEKKYTNYADSLISAAKLYNDSYSEDLFGSLKYGCNYITYQQLVNKNLIKDIQVDGISCNSENTFIRVIKMNDKYIYKYYLGCGKKKSDGTVESVTKALPGPNKHEMDTTLCGSVSDSSILVTADPVFAGSKYDAHIRATKIVLKSFVPITRTDFNINYKWEWTYKGEKKSTNFKRISISIPSYEEQQSTIDNGDELIFSSSEIKTPSSANGDVHLIIEVTGLTDINGFSWVNRYDSSSNQFDVNNNADNTKTYKVDNDSPFFTENPKIESKDPATHSIDTTITFKAKDELAKQNELKYCVTESNSCSDSNFKAYKEKVDYHFASYDGKEKTVNIFIRDLAGNEVKESLKYKLAKIYTLTYDSNGGVACSPNKKNVYVVEGINSSWGELCKPHYDNRQFLGWNTKRDGSGDTIDKDTKVTKNLTVYAQWRKSQVIFRIELPSGDSITPVTTSTDGRYRYKWTNDTADGTYYYVYKSVNDDASSVYEYKIDYDATTLNLPDYDNPNYIYITHGSLIAYSGKEWKCTNCKTNGQVFSHNSIPITPTNICNTNNGDCKVTLRVNWNESKVKIKMMSNGGIMATPHGAAYTISGGKILKNGGEVIHEITYGGKLSEYGLLDYNNSSYLNVKRDGYHVDSGSEWNTKADGTGTSFSQNGAYNGSDFCNASSGDCTTTLYINWKKDIVTKTITYYDQNGTTKFTNLTPKSYTVGTGETVDGNVGGGARPADKTDYVFNGWKYGTRMEWAYTISTAANTDYSFYSLWCNKCSAGSHAHCTLNASTAGSCKYTTSCDSGYEYASGESTYNPKCKEKAYNIYYGGIRGAIKKSGNAPTTYKSSSGERITAKYEKSGYTFGGWSINENPTTGSYEKTISAGSTGDKYFYALWCDNDTEELVEGSPNKCKPKASVPSDICYDDKSHGSGVGSKFFGSSPEVGVNMGQQINTTSWGNWCKINWGSPYCYVSVGYHRVCYTEACGGAKGHTADFINSHYGCDYYTAWCTYCDY